MTKYGQKVLKLDEMSFDEPAKERKSYLSTHHFPWVYLTVSGNKKHIEKSMSLFDLSFKSATNKDEHFAFSKNKSENHKQKVCKLLAAAMAILSSHDEAAMLIGQLNRDFYQLEPMSEVASPEESSVDYQKWQRVSGVFIPDHIGIYLNQAGIHLSNNQIGKQDIQNILEGYKSFSQIVKTGS